MDKENVVEGEWCKHGGETGSPSFCSLTETLNEQLSPV